MTSSKMSSAPSLSQRSRRPCKKPGLGPTTPMLAATGSTMIQAISPGYWAKRAFTLSRSLKEAVRVSLAVPRGTPAELGLPPSATAEDPALTSMQSLWPW